MSPQLDATHYADDETLTRLDELERTNKTLAANYDAQERRAKASEAENERLTAERDAARDERDGMLMELAVAKSANSLAKQIMAELDACAAAHVACDAEREKLRLRVEELVRLLREAGEYMTHTPTCRGMPRCDCGYRDCERRILAAIDAEVAKR